MEFSSYDVGDDDKYNGDGLVEISIIYLRCWMILSLEREAFVRVVCSSNWWWATGPSVRPKVQYWQPLLTPLMFHSLFAHSGGPDQFPCSLQIWHYWRSVRREVYTEMSRRQPVQAPHTYLSDRLSFYHAQSQCWWMSVSAFILYWIHVALYQMRI